MQRDAFISYSHKMDVPLAQAVHRGLHRIGRNWRKLRALNVFRDTESLGASPDLAGSILKELKRSTHFIYIASPEAAASRWVREELAFWRDHPEGDASDRFLIALSDGEIHWDEAAGDFDWTRTTAIPQEVLRGVFRTEPLWVDLRQFRTCDPAERTLDGGEFRDRTTALAAAVHGCTKDELDSEDLRQHRKASRVKNVVLALLALTSLAATTAGFYAAAQRDEALARARTSASQALAARAMDTAGKDARKAAQFALYAYAVKPTSEATQALAQAVVANDGVSRHLQVGNEEVNNFRGLGHVNATQVAISRDGGMLAYYSDFDPDHDIDTDGHIHLYDIRAGKALPHLKGKAWPQDGGGMAFSADGTILAVETPFNQVEIWDVPRQKVLRTITASDGENLAGAFKRLRSFAFSSDGQRLAAAFHSPTAAGSDYYVAVWETATGREISKSPAAADSLTLGFDTANRLHALDHQAGTVRTLAREATSWSAKRTIPGFPRQERIQVKLSDDGTKAYLGEGTNELWDLVEGRRLGKAVGQGSMAVTLPGGMDGTVFAADDKAVSVLDTSLRRGRVLGTFTWPVRSVSASGDGRWVAAGSQDGAVSLFSTTSYRGGTPLPIDEQFKSAALADDKRTAFRSGDTGTDVWTVTGKGVRSLGRVPLQLVRSGLRVDTVIASPDGSRAVVAQDGKVSLWDLRSGTGVNGPMSGGAAFAPMSFLPDGHHVVGTTGEAVQVVDSRTWEVRQSVPYGAAPPDAVGISADGSTLALVHEEQLAVWEWTAKNVLQQERTVSLKPVWTVYGHSVTVSADGRQVAVLNFDGLLSILDVTTGRIVHSTYASTGGPALAFSSDASLLVQSSGSGQEPALQFWDPATGESRGSWALPISGSGKDSAITHLFEGDDGSILALAMDGALVRRTVDVTAWRTLLCQLAPGELPRSEYVRYLSGLNVSPPCRRDSKG
ncbi:hypothetical protein [Streptomyces sp. NPDC090022]|uniref:hypothetical protein n=1 Tax=Streptomyces sp. NPDC090022 TaxID=3365920 RepID=UPI00380EEFD6